MSEQSRDNLENFFRDRTQYHNIEFVEDDWLDLKKRLDKEMPVGGFLAFIRKYWYLPLLLLLFPLAWFSYDQYSEKTGNRAAEDLTLQVLGESIDDQSVIQNSENMKSKAQKQTSVQNSSNSTSASTKSSNTQNLAVGSNTEESHIVPQRAYLSKVIGYAVGENGAQPYRSSTIELHFLSSIIPASLIEASNANVSFDHEDHDEIISPKQKKLPFTIGVGYSPDFSTVGIGNFVSPGSRWIIAAEYAISNRLLLNTGYVMINNKYEAYGEDYHAPSRYWKNGIVADEAYGECKMIEIPLNLRYNIVIKNKSSIFLSGGASTYLVLKEDYYFHYEQEDPDLPDHWGTDEMTVYPFGIINLSAGYQYQFTKKSSLQVEPFIRIPTVGIGWGNVDLYSMGMFFMYKYQIGK
jgi:hypothetical protein